MFSYCSLEEDFVRWRELFWPAVLSKYNIDIREIRRQVLVVTGLCYINCYVTGKIIDNNF